jgi:hypothetical protein
MEARRHVALMRVSEFPRPRDIPFVSLEVLAVYRRPG